MSKFWFFSVEMRRRRANPEQSRRTLPCCVSAVI